MQRPKVWLRRQVYRLLTSSRRRGFRRWSAERRRRRDGRAHRIAYFHRFGDPTSALMVGLVAALRERYDIEVELMPVGAPELAVAPEPERLIAYARLDAARLARKFGLGFTDPGHAPDAALMARATAILVAALSGPDPLTATTAVDKAVWSGDAVALDELAHRHGEASAEATAKAVAEGTERRNGLGHFQAGSIHYGGEWYWGADRLHYLEARLDGLKVRRQGREGAAPLAPALLETQARGDARGVVLEIYPSLRSPYTWIAMERAFALAERWGATPEIRFVLPMVMRNLPVPPRKGRYFLVDTKREAERLGLPFGNICDPVGRPTERGLAVLHHAILAGKGRDFLISFLKGVWAEGIDAGSDAGLKRIAARAGIDWSAVEAALADDSWRKVAEMNRARLLSLGLWGVPSFHVGDLAVWGQDRLWLVEEELARIAAKGEGKA